MIKAPDELQDLRRKIYAKAKAEPHLRFWGLYVHVCKRERVSMPADTPMITSSPSPLIPMGTNVSRLPTKMTSSSGTPAAIAHQRTFCDTRAIRSSALERNSLRIGDVFKVL